MIKQRMQTTDTLLMIRPARFGFNAETAGTNVFQKSIVEAWSEIRERALKEFDAFVKLLRSNKIYVIVLEDDGSRNTPDSIFPNNWISFHDGQMVLYPMLAESRRRERRSDWIRLLKQCSGSKEMLDLTAEEQNGRFLEGTGSIVLDRANKIAFANISSRTNEELFRRWCSIFDFEAVIFHASTKEGDEIYHTNVLMAVGERTAVICSEVIRNKTERRYVLEKLSHNQCVIEITEEQMHHFCGNLLLVKNREGKNFWVMSEQAHRHFSEKQKEMLRLDGELRFSNLETIEGVGGGSARCMIAEMS
ncbi:MAG: amidinotransferase [Chitinophagales bacterium]|nr:amidinotransferase [Chitinophagales bacterium]